jgi:calcineurin-like phosphoesterase family protein
MNAVLVDNWNDAVKPGDHVWVLGDFALGKIADTLPIAALLNGHKHLLCGNHDRCWDGHRKTGNWTQKYLDAGFASVVQGTITLTIDRRKVDACHFPYVGDSHDADRFNDHRPVDKGEWLLHGHVHNAWRQRGRMINVGVDAWGFTPVSEAQLAALIHDGVNDIPCPIYAKEH